MPDQIIVWRRKQGSLNESAWLKEGIKLYRRLLQTEPDNTDYKVELAKMLVRSGEDEKLVHVNLINAKELFNEVLEIFPDDTNALYRMGHIHYEAQEYEKSIEYFTKAIHTSLSKIRLFRAYATMAKAFYKLGDDLEAIRYLDKAIDSDEEHNFSGELNEVRALITQKGQQTRAIRYPDGTYMLATIDDVENVKMENEDNEATLDMAHLRPTFSGPKDVAELQRKEAEVLKYLIEKGRIVSKEELIQYVWPEDEAPETTSIKPIISKINRKVKKCLPENTQNPIVNKRGQGYMWSSIETKIITLL
ncbi:winged helix-turn-helix domain-containing protein [Fredinandcohnia onubensis]|uniref:winged helix-turn-helix domain-containing protein n=1 Tax=Fredinandcohnia onubensis TaxID=1571209 RepID=UPI000C0BCA14|nr:winged helix-turn-helix domain-containing protein [Fredinandcohnia onubensis]